MQSTDLTAFGDMLDAVCSLLSRGAYKPNPTNTALFFRSLARYSLADVRAGFDAHVSDPQRGRFVPMPADIISQIIDRAADDGRPGAEEAWAIAMRGRDEAETIVWTAEAAEAFGIAQPILAAGDEVGSRMAFKEAYVRLVDVARAARRPAAWTPSIGHDPERRARAIAEAAGRGLLDGAQFPALPAPRASVALLAAPTQGIPEEARIALLALRQWLTTPSESASPDAAAKEATAQAKRLADERVARYTVPVPTTPPVRHFTETDKDSE